MKLLDRLPKPTWARVALAVVAILIVWTAAATVYRFVSAPRKAAANKAEAVTQQEATKATAGAAQEAITVVNETRREVVRIDEITRRNERVIKQAAGADTRAPGVAAALHRSLCERAAYHGEPDCAALRGDGGELGAARSDPGNGTPLE